MLFTRRQTLEAIAVMQAFADGKDVEYRSRGSQNPWCTLLSCASWDWHSVDYRIKQSPLEFWGVADPYGSLICLGVDENVAREEHAKRGGRVIKLREVV